MRVLRGTHFRAASLIGTQERSATQCRAIVAVSSPRPTSTQSGSQRCFTTRRHDIGLVPRRYFSTSPRSNIHDYPDDQRKWDIVVENPDSRLRKAGFSRGGLELCIGGSRPAIKRNFLPGVWLRDNCRCTKCVNQDTRQRNFNTFEIPSEIKIEELREDPQGVQVQWSDGHVSTYPWSFLEFYQTSDKREPEDVKLVHFGAEAAENPPTISYKAVMRDDKAVGELTKKIKENGFVFITNTPFSNPTDTEKLLERIAFIRITHYGGFYDFTPDLAMADTAYTNLALPAHTDTTYFSDPAGLQAFHLLSHTGPSESSGSAEGGKSLLVDGFHAASILKREDPRAYEVLASVRLPWHASGNEGITISPDKRYPVLEVDEDNRELMRVRWNNDDRGVVPFGEEFTPLEWYDAARKWDEILRRKEVEVWIQLTPGSVLVFDNWRVLHGRSAFQGVRRICGGYINRDDFISRWRNTNFERNEILNRIIG